MKKYDRNFLPTLHSPRAFTLVEVLLAIALIAAMVALIAGATSISAERLAQRPAEAVLSTAIKRASIEAMHKGRSVNLSFDERGFFLISDVETGQILAKIFLDAQRDLKEKQHQAKLAVEAEKEPTDTLETPADFKSVFLDEDNDFFDLPSSAPKFFFYQNYPKLINSVSIKFPAEAIKFLRFAPDSTMTFAKIILQRGDEETEFETDPFCGNPRNVTQESKK